MRGRVPHTLPRRVGSLLAAPRQSSECSWHHLVWPVGPSLPVRLQKRSSFTWPGYTPSPVRICPLNARGGHPSAEGGAQPVPCGVPGTRGTELSCCPLLALDCSSLLPAAFLSGQRHSHLHQPPGEPARLRRSAVRLALSACRANPACLGAGGPRRGPLRRTLASFGRLERGGWVHDEGIGSVNENSPAGQTFNLLFLHPAGERPPPLSFSWLPAGSEQAELGAAAPLSWAHCTRPGACVAPWASPTPRFSLILCMMRGPSQCFAISVPLGGTKLVACGRLVKGPWCKGQALGKLGVTLGGPKPPQLA